MLTVTCIHQATGVPVTELHCPPVWGFVGSQIYIDVNNVVYHGITATAVQDTTPPSRNHKYLRSLLLKSVGVAEAVNVNDDGNEWNAEVSQRSRWSITDLRMNSRPDIILAIIYKK